MPVFFRPAELRERSKGYTFDDVLIVPNHSEVLSRGAPNLKCQVTKNYYLEAPIVSANMDTITEKEMAMAMGKIGGLGIIHRFMDPMEQSKQVKEVKEYFQKENINLPVSASIGVKKESLDRARALVDSGADIITIDIAHGDSKMMLDILGPLKKNYPSVDVIAGNVATEEGCKTLIEEGADCIKVGIGPGSMCTTRIITGCGVPQLTAIRLCVEMAKKYKVPLIADGGIKNSGDIVKALSIGANTVMLGSMLSGTLETPGEIHNGKKTYRGMASKSAQISWRGTMPQGMAPEGVTTTVSCKGPVNEVLGEILGGVRSGMSYLNAFVLEEMEEKVRFVEITPSGVRESNAHGLFN